MSNVTNVILHIGIMEEEDEKIKEVNAFFDNDEKPLIDIDNEAIHGWYGGSKYLECNLYVGAFNYFHLEGFISHLKTIEWDVPEDLQLIIMRHDDSRFEIIQVWEDKQAYLKEKGFPENKRPVDENGMRYDYVLVDEEVTEQ